VKALDHVNVFGETGEGKTHAVICLISSHFLIFVTSDRRTESLAEPDWLENDKNAIVAKMAKITITTINSTNVNQLKFLSLKRNIIKKLKNKTLSLKRKH
jgi:hypothetical protein